MRTKRSKTSLIGSTEGSNIPQIEQMNIQPWIGLYTGGGTSHSWLWFIDLFEKFKLINVFPIDENDIKSGVLNFLDILCISGGDTFKIAEYLDYRGAKNLQQFIQKGGIYLGVCAGAYLPLRSSKPPLNLFNYANVKITNLTKNLPQALTLPHKFCTRYGCEYVFHPVRDEVILHANGSEFSHLRDTLVAPLYGGPLMLTVGCSCEVLATYSGFTEKTIFLVDRNLAEETLIGKAAVVREKMHNGVLYLFGPHFEHPNFTIANQILANIINWEFRSKYRIKDKKIVSCNVRRVKKDFIQLLKKELSNCRIVSTGLEMFPIYWVIGNKAYEPINIRLFLDSIWKRIKPLCQFENILCFEEEDQIVLSRAFWLTKALRKLKIKIDDGHETTELAMKIFAVLSEITKYFFRLYFRTIRGHISNHI